ncbi:MAG: hypothetical protein WC443_05605, partial [Desulfobaccales bacterium]
SFFKQIFPDFHAKTLPDTPGVRGDFGFLSIAISEKTFGNRYNSSPGRASLALLLSSPKLNLQTTCPSQAFLGLGWFPG